MAVRHRDCNSESFAGADSVDLGHWFLGGEEARPHGVSRTLLCITRWPTGVEVNRTKMKAPPNRGDPYMIPLVRISPGWKLSEATNLPRDRDRADLTAVASEISMLNCRARLNYRLQRLIGAIVPYETSSHRDC